MSPCRALHDDYFPLVVMNAILGGLFSSRLNLNLREAHAYTYGAHSRVRLAPRGEPVRDLDGGARRPCTADACARSLTEFRAFARRR